MNEYGLPASAPRLSDKEMFDLAHRSAWGDTQAREQLISSHLYLVHMLVRQNLGRGVDEDDLFQEGCYGLILAIEHFDPDRGVTLSTYAQSWINKYIKKCLRQQQKEAPIQLPERLYYRLVQYQNTFYSLYSTYGRPPTDDEIASYMEISVRTVRDLKRWVYTFVPAEERDYELSPPPGMCNPSPEETTLNAVLDLTPYGARLTKREEDLLKRRLGFGTPNGEPESYQSISANTGRSIESLRREYWAIIGKIQSALATQTEKQHL